MKSIHAAAAVSLVAIFAVGCKPAPAPEAPAAAPAAPAAETTPTAAAELTVSKSVVIAASADTVWAKAKDFNGLGTWHPAIAKSEIVEGTNNTVGAVRLLTLAGDPPATIKEKLTALDDAGKTFSYEILEGPLPVSGYASTFVVAAEGEGAKVTWSSKFKAAGADDATATSAIEGVYVSGLDNLKKILETK